MYESFPTKAAAESFARKVEARTVLDGRAPDVVHPDALTVAKWWARWAGSRSLVAGLDPPDPHQPLEPVHPPSVRARPD